LTNQNLWPVELAPWALTIMNAGAAATTGAALNAGAVASARAAGNTAAATRPGAPSGGTVIIPQEEYRSHGDCLLPARAMVLWHYTDLSDPRWAVGAKYLRLNVMASMTEPQKVGVTNKQGWAAYARGTTLFVKTFPYVEGVRYPDGGCNCETYTEGAFVEIESVGPLAAVAPGGSVTHVETWRLFKGVAVGANDESVDAAIRPVLAKIRK
jgi:hypothetical protein